MITAFISCKKESEKVIVSKLQTSETLVVDFAPYGDSLISQSAFVNEIQKSSNVKSQRNSLSKIKFDYDKFSKWSLNTIEEKSIGKIVLKFEKEKKQNADADIYTHINLSIYKNNKKIDDLIVYKQENYAEALVAINQYFYIDTILNLWTLGVDVDEDGTKVTFWNQYKINPESGKISLIQNKQFVNSPDKEIDKNSSWEGKYFFEKSNKDELKTSFEISITQLNDIKVVYVGDGEKPEIYKNLSGELIGDNKIKVVFNEKYAEMGIIYIQKSGNEYIISEDPIANINAGSEEFPLKKIK